MTSVFLLGHGGYWTGENDASADGMFTYVPPGLTVHFYALPNEGLPSVNAVKILTTNGIGDLGSVAPSNQIPNYCFSPLEEVPWRRIFSLIPADRMPAGVRFIGDGDLDGVDRLCLNDGSCTSAGHGRTCFGLFQKLPVGTTDLHLLSCRVGPLPVGSDIAAAAARYPNTKHIPGESPNNPVHYDGVLQQVGTFLNEVGWDEAKTLFSDAENVKATQAFDALDPVDRAKLLSADQIWSWRQLREAREEFRKHQSDPDLSQFAHWLTDNRDTGEIKLYRKDSVLGPVITKAGI